MSFNVEHKAQERKSRRTHKNSKDGCPNCKAKRVKCTEELPSCFNCIKRNYRCGYLDFPKEKLDHIRKKNEKKKMDGLANGDGHVMGPGGGDVGTHSSGSVNDMVSSDGSSKYGAQDYYMMDTRSIGSGNPSGYLQATSDSISPGSHGIVGHHSRHHNHQARDESRPVYEKTKNILFQDSFSKFFSNMNMNNTYGDGGAAYHEQGSISNDGSESDVNIGMMMQHNHELHSKTSVNKHHTYSGNNEFIARKESNDSRMVDDGSRPLQNAIHEGYTFNKTKVLAKYKNFICPHEMQKKSKADDMAIDKFRADYSPIWTHNNADSIWRAIYRNATVYPLYYNFFMDRALNFIMTRRNKLATSQVYTPSSLDMTDSETYSSSSSSDGYESMIKYDVLRILVNKSYVYYGNLINVLRKSLSEIDIVYSTKISLYSYYTTFLHFHATTETVCLMNTGTASLVTKILNEVDSVDQLDESIYMLAHWFNAHSTFSLAPDYNFSIIENIYDDLMDLKKFILENKQFAVNCSHVIGSIMDLQMFLNYLINVFRPQVVKINNYYKSLKGIKDESDNIYFTSFTLFFEMLKNWFKIFPSQALAVNSKDSPLKKVFYLFFPTLGKALVNVFSPLRSMTFIDLLKVFYPSLDFDQCVYHFGPNTLPAEQYAFLSRLSTKLLRVHAFFNNRISLLAYHFSNLTVLHEPHIKAVDPPPPGASIQHRDNVQICPTKLPIQEQMVDKFTESEVITAAHYPNVHFVDSYDTYNKKLREEDQRQRAALNNRRAGMAPSVSADLDFDPTELISVTREYQKRIWQAEHVALDELRLRHYNFEVSVREISSSVKQSEFSSSSDL